MGNNAILPRSDIYLAYTVDAAIITDKDFKITYLNPAAISLYGYTLKELMGQTPSILNAEPLAKDIQNEIYSSMKRGESWSGTAKNQKKDGTLFICEMKIFPLGGDTEDTYAYASIQRDITTQIRILEEKSRLLDELQKRNKELDCLYTFSQIAERKGITLEEIFQNLVDLLPSGMQNPKDYCSRLTVNSDIYYSPHFKDTKWKIEHDQFVNNEIAFKLEIFFLKEQASVNEPFHKKEKEMIFALVENLAGIIKRKYYKQELIGINRTLNLIYQTNRHILQSNTLSSFLKNACKLITEIDNYEMVWIGRKAQESTEIDLPIEFRIVTQHGDTNNFINKYLVNQYDITTDEVSDAAVKQNRPVVLKSSSADANFEPWRLKLLKHGYQSSISLPLTVSNKSYGVLSIYSSKNNAFGPKQTELLIKLTSDICFGIEFLKIRASKKRGELQVKGYQSQLRLLFSKLVETKEHKGRQIAEDLHDGIGQTLAISKIKLSMLQEKSLSEEIKNIASDVIVNIDEAIKNTRAMISELSPTILYELGLKAALEWLSEHFKSHFDIPIVYNCQTIRKESFTNLHDDLKIFVFRSIHELLMNSIKHSKTDVITITHSTSGESMELTVRDWGIGFYPGNIKTSYSSGFGLFSIKERIKYFKGSMDIYSAPGIGCTTTIKLPMTYRGKK